MKTIVNKYNALLLIVLFHAFAANAQSTDKNYIQTWDLKVAGYKTSGSISGNTPLTHAIRTIQYYDGLGRLSQTVVPGFAPDGKSMVTPKVYNKVGLDTTNYQPYIASTGEPVYRGNYADELITFYEDNYYDRFGNAPVEYEKSPLKRIVKQGAPGADWQLEDGHFVTFEYLTNNSSAELKAINWKATGDLCVHNGLYPAAELYVTKVTAEDGAIAYNFKDKLGNVVLKRSKAPLNEYADTYYVYDDFNLLRFVISPEGSSQITGNFSMSDDLARKFVYFYKYDNRKRLIEKKLPGKEPEYTVYNQIDMPIMYQDGNMRKMNGAVKAYEWLYTKYDALGRVIITGITTEYSSQTRDQVQSLADASEYCWEYLLHPSSYPVSFYNYYSGQSFPWIQPGSIQTLTYYDTYNVIVKSGSTFTPQPIVSDSEMNFNPADANFSVSQPDTEFIKGLPTVTFILSQGSLLPTVTYYDKRGRVIQVRQKGHISGAYTITTNNYYNGQPENITNTVYNTNIKHKYIPPNSVPQSITEKYTFEYDNFGRLSLRDYQVGDVMALHKVQNNYTPLGQLRQKIISEGGISLQTVDYSYNIRGWLSAINNPSQVSSSGDLFGMNIYYNTINQGLNNTARFNGNISATEWQTVQTSSSLTPPTTGRKAYVYSYDELSRLENAVFSEYTSGAWQQTSKYNELIKSYDLNGNIKGIERKGSLSNWNTDIIDNLTYYYNGNQLIAVDDAVLTDNGYDFYDNANFFNGTLPEYEYDANGNVIKDANKGIIGITYNHMNLPKEVYFSNDSKLDYYYDATGNKLRQDVIEAKILTKRTDFISNFVIVNNAPAWINYDEGRVIMDGTTVHFTETHLKDHLGNTRVVFGYKNNALAVKQVNSYYPFGMNIKGLTTRVTIEEAKHPANEYLYNGKMFQDELGLDWLDYGARFYDAQIGRWHSVDPLAEDFPSWTPSHYCHNNPIVLIDPDGRSADWYQSESGALLWQDENQQQITVNGEQFKNVGTSASIGAGDGNYINYYQNVPVSISNAPVNAQETVLNNAGLKGQLLSRNSPLSEKSQVGLMIENINYGKEKFLSCALDIAVSSIETSGDLISLSGYGFTATGIGAEIGLPMIVLGGTISAFGGYAQSGIAFARGNVQLGTSKLITTTAGLGLSTPVMNSKGFSAMEKVGINAWIDGPKAIIDKTLQSTFGN
ncbi:protein containing RHS repeat-associated core domain [Lentimicrobium saccharophilum]|uniref:Protein containing RHS repeat-associated core domain n=1 Tax=Lentimicrobium saccharophilum TaxID=1678841 RepID=A0A0S7C0F1_9BACT|nr:DUF6443 domain-containing protein [Lentimicrobium saccharophilum]GAP43970.1 protein containing RHS repeat-associated core domain [Lentimicrobium saccharophilum]